MKKETKNNFVYIVNGISISVLILLGYVIEISVLWPYLKYIGWILLGLGIFFVVASTYTLISNRGKGLIDWGIYSILRHPMYVGAMLIYLSWSFFLPHWLTLLLSLTNIAILYGFILQGDRRNVELFGSEYEQYIERVPRVNYLSGFLKSLRRG